MNLIHAKSISSKMTKTIFRIVLFFIMFVVSMSCSPLFLQKHKNLSYALTQNIFSNEAYTLNIFSHKDYKERPIILFAYGGSWVSGKKELYNFLGKRFARKGYVAVIINYPLAPEFKVQEMSLAVAEAINWTYENIQAYGGDHNKLFVAGHSAGGHLITLNSLNDRNFDSLQVKNPISGAILIDAAGLDMYTYLKEEKLAAGTSYLRAFTNDPEIWKEHSPIYYLDKEDPKLLILMGGKTYPGIKSSSEKFLRKADALEIKPTYHLQPKKSHIQMILQFYWPWSKPYKWIDEFINKKD